MAARYACQAAFAVASSLSVTSTAGGRLLPPKTLCAFVDRIVEHGKLNHNLGLLDRNLVVEVEFVVRIVEHGQMNHNLVWLLDQELLVILEYRMMN